MAAVLEDEYRVRRNMLKKSLHEDLRSTLYTTTDLTDNGKATGKLGSM